ncbi:hypothetical protein [Ruegeria sp. Ofav3-42]|uniref:hypothetical protein n=1 Tax=Ruegeria sp. Ofav3-42 TaxID=2917759 RepID=UPI001EF66744|nr:hypothetical protein [Ruegeria sp. Ofav3-42]MCG7522758.1 hypothetical protein [Ruegeria sp. Ofav3-42]
MDYEYEYFPVSLNASPHPNASGRDIVVRNPRTKSWCQEVDGYPVDQIALFKFGIFLPYNQTPLEGVFWSEFKALKHNWSASDPDRLDCDDPAKFFRKDGYATSVIKMDIPWASLSESEVSLVRKEVVFFYNAFYLARKDHNNQRAQVLMNAEQYKIRQARSKNNVSKHDPRYLIFKPHDLPEYQWRTYFMNADDYVYVWSE